MPLSAGQVLQERYRIDALLGQGGMGAVYRGTDMRFSSPVAIKENKMAAPASQRQFAREARLLHQLRHPNLPRVTDHYTIAHQGQYLVMDYVEGDDLKQLIARHGAAPQARALRLIDGVLAALGYLHAQNIIHRDVKPANVKITPAEQVFLVDFGLAKVYDPVQQTTLGARGITPGYAPPEQYGQGRTDARSDIYSTAATLYSLLTAATPPDAWEYVTRQAAFRPPRQLNPEISPGVEAAILRAMAIAPDDRFQTVTSFRAALAAPPAPPARPVSPRPARKRERSPRPEPSAPAPRAAPESVQPAPEVAASPAVVAPPAPRSRKRFAWLALVAALLGAMSAVLEANGVGSAVGHMFVAGIVLGLMVYYARRPLQRTAGQFQADVLVLWLAVTLAYVAILSAMDENPYDAWEVPMGTAIGFWLPSAVLGAAILWLARRRAVQKQA